MTGSGPSSIRLNASPQTSQDGRDAPFAAPRTCLECGRPLDSHKAGAEFCSSAHRMAFNNRRAQRGAELYDLFMALRHDRATATLFKVWRLLNRLAALFRAEDRAERAGRVSWRHPAEILARRPYLRAEVVATPASGSRGQGR